MKKILKKILILTIGTELLTIGLFFFLMPYNLTIGGVSGLSMSLNAFFPQIPTGIYMMIIDISLYIAGFLLIGKAFGIYSIYSSMLFSISTTILEKIFPNQQPITDDILVSLILGIMISALGIGLVLNQNASTGGTDIIALILKKYIDGNIGLFIFICDFFVVLFGCFAFDLSRAMYSLIGILINSTIIDRVVAGFNTKISVFINTTEYEKVNEYIIKEIDRGSTLFYAQGGYTRKERVVIHTVLDRKQFLKMKNFIHNVDPSAFLSVSQVSEVHGEGFTFRTDDLPQEF